jgi:hypothetical protein
MGKKAQSPFEGLWHIVSMETWEEDYFNEKVQAFTELEENGTGHFQFGYVQGYIDWRQTTRGNEPAVEWTWEGNDEMDPAQGRGWAVLEDDELHGTIFIHLGDESGFVAKRAKPQKGSKRKRRGD